MNKQPLIVELLTEELPPKALQKLGEAFAKGITENLFSFKLIENTKHEFFATPRRLAVYLPAVLGQAAEQKFTEKLMPANIGIDTNGNPSAALTKKLNAKNLGHLQISDLVKKNDGKQDMLYAQGIAPGAKLADALQIALDFAINHLPIPKVMQYQLANGESVKFVRPAHKLVAIWGETVVSVKTLGLSADRISLGHRFMGTSPITINSADSWQTQLADQGQVIASFNKRKNIINDQLKQAADSQNATIGSAPETFALLDEVAALVEHPTVYIGEFEPEFLQVPAECLILTMRLNQKYFPLFKPDTGELTNKFLIVSNIALSDPSNVIKGNQKVVRPRLADAQFFYETDLKTKLCDRVSELANSIYHNKLGTALERSERIQAIAKWLAPLLGADTDQAQRAALLAHADLNTQMVGEFPELQGIMGAYYANHDGEPQAVIEALKDQYQIRINDVITTEKLVATVLFMAIRAETLVGIWGIGLAPTGERDPYGLRRAALGLISAYEQLTVSGWLNANQDSKANLKALLETAYSTFANDVLATSTVDEVLNFVFERYKNQLANSFDRNIIDAVLACEPPIHQVYARIQACVDFVKLPEAESLSAANKRIANLLKKADINAVKFDNNLLKEPAEIALANTIKKLQPLAAHEFNSGNFTASLAVLAQARAPVDQFFADVMVMDKDESVKQNRLALLASLHQLMQQVADISRLSK